tara:strand:- start:155 stop:508 length:354 start_codon:yes stop_codon:yes gene_type:complete
MSKKVKIIVSEKQVRDHFKDRKIVPVVLLDVHDIIEDLKTEGLSSEDLARFMSVRDEDVAEEIRYLVMDVMKIFNDDRKHLLGKIYEYIKSMTQMHDREHDRDENFWVSPGITKVEA